MAFYDIRLLDHGRPVFTSLPVGHCLSVQQYVDRWWPGAEILSADEKDHACMVDDITRDMNGPESTQLELF